jgi:hypothetical protein
MNKFNDALCLHSSPNPPERPSNQALLIFLALALGLTLVAGSAVYLGGTVITEVTPTYIRVEVVGKPK